jgi:hypothetical protein
MTNLQVQRLAAHRLPEPAGRRLVVLTGARQVGKTTLARSRYAALRYVNLDAIEDRDALRAVASASWGRHIGPAVIDEVQKEPSLLEKVKYAYDDGSLDFSVLLGSAHILLMQRVRESLAGRVFLHELWPLTIAELAAGASPADPPLLVRLLDAGVEAPALLAEQPRLLLGDEAARRIEAVRHVATWGGMPALLALDDRDRREWLRSYHETFLQRDLADLARLSDLEPFFRFQRLAALRTGRLLSYSELARDAGTSPGTARNYLEYLRISYQALLLQPYASNVTSSVVKAPKLYWSDVGIARHLQGARGPLTGELFETVVVSETVKLLRTLGLDAEPTFYRTRSGFEVDLLLGTSAGVLAVEAKAREAAAPSDFRGLRALAAGLGPRFIAGLVVTTGAAVEPAADDPRLWTVGAARLFS